MADRTVFLTQTRQLASLFIRASNAYNALSAELLLTDATLTPEEGGLGSEDFQGNFSDINQADVIAFYTTLGTVLGALTDEQKKTIYAVKTTTPGIGDGPIPSI